MWTDAIVEEVRKARRDMVKDAGGDLHSLCEMLRKKERSTLDSVSDKRPVPLESPIHDERS